MTELILASGSPRRKQILEENGIKFKIEKIETEENFENKFSPEVMSLSFAFEKAYKIALKHPEALVLGADTVVACGDEILGKPKDKDEAYGFLKMLSGNRHSVITGFCLISLANSIKLVDYDESFVDFREISDREILDYIETDEPYDKAGGYAVQGEAGKFIKAVSGSKNNVIGLPIEKIKKHLERINERRN